eukprot:16816-Heterococcus_DN1.PRE.1
MHQSVMPTSLIISDLEVCYKTLCCFPIFVIEAQHDRSNYERFILARSYRTTAQHDRLSTTVHNEFPREESTSTATQKALLRGDEIVNQLGASQPPLCFIDAAFASCDQALYRTPQPPPAGAMPASICACTQSKTSNFSSAALQSRAAMLRRFCMQPQTHAMSTAATYAALPVVTAMFCLQ